MMRPPSAKRCVMMCGLSSPESSVWTWKTCAVELDVVVEADLRAPEARALRSPSRAWRARSRVVALAIASSSAPCSPRDPFHALERQLRDCGAADRCAAPRRGAAGPSGSFGPLAAHAVEHAHGFVRAALLDQPLGDARCRGAGARCCRLCHCPIIMFLRAKMQARGIAIARRVSSLPPRVCARVGRCVSEASIVKPGS